MCKPLVWLVLYSGIVKLYHTFKVINLMYFVINTNITLRKFPLLVKTYHKYGHSDMTRRQNCTICHASHWIITSKTKIVSQIDHKMTSSPVWSITLIPYNFLNPEQEIKHDILFKRVQDSRTYWRAYGWNRDKLNMPTEEKEGKNLSRSDRPMSYRRSKSESVEKVYWVPGQRSGRWQVSGLLWSLLEL